jgi:tetratricopeptide (TPR) repeat protein
MSGKGNAIGYALLGFVLAGAPSAVAQSSAAGGSALAHFNICATYYNSGKTVEALPECDAAIASNPSMADAYFVKGSILFGNGTVDGGGKYHVPPDTVSALNKYLELAPNGPHAADVHAMLDSLK